MPGQEICTSTGATTSLRHGGEYQLMLINLKQPLKDGGEQVTRFYLPGDHLGLDGLASGQHASGGTYCQFLIGFVCTVARTRSFQV